ncbi:MAG: hypothetical protein GXY86_16585 [Firmicutes bacterium]|nr:hypothetical protein [Bacillota bacterium]
MTYREKQRPSWPLLKDKGLKMKRNIGEKLYKYSYKINFWLILYAFLHACIVNLFGIKEISKNVIILELLVIYYTALLLAPTLCVSFLGLNIWGLFIDKPNRKKLIITIIFLIIWISWGIYAWSRGVVTP